MIEFTEWAQEILGKAAAAAARLNPDARVRLAPARAGMEAVLVEAPEDGDATADVGGATIYVAAGLEGLVDIEEPHDRIVLRPAGSTPNERAH